MIRVEVDEVINMKEYGFNVTGSVMFEYVSWVLFEAKKRKILRLYFLARDGYLLYQIAIRLCDAFDLGIECKYLYCSRLALRTPSYHLIGDEAYDLLLSDGYNITPLTLMKRARLDEKDYSEILKELQVVDRNKTLSRSEFKQLSSKIRKSEQFRRFVEEKSKDAYTNTIGYLHQEGLFDTNNVSIVDSGWSGSIQRSLRQLLESGGYKGNIIGFYFGMYTAPKEAKDGEYLTFYFNHVSGKKRKILFCNNLFECMLSAPHGMTTGYKKDKSGFVPILKDGYSLEMERLIVEQIDRAIAFTCDRMLQSDLFLFNLKKTRGKVFNILRRAMVYPTKEELKILSKFIFCDDITEGYHMSLADKNMIKELKNYMIIPNILRKVFSYKKTESRKQLFWPYAVIAFLPKLIQPWYRFNIYVYQWIKFTIE